MLSGCLGSQQTILRGIRLGKTLLVLFAGLAVLAIPQKAAGQQVVTEPLPVVAVEPADGERMSATSHRVPFEVRLGPEYRPTSLQVEISSQNVPGQDGTLADDFVEDRVHLSRSDAYPDTYSGLSGAWGGGAWWTSRSGTYFWQAHSKAYECIETGCRWVVRQTPVYTLQVVALTRLSVRAARRAARSAIRRETRRRPRGLKYRCDRRTRQRVDCNPSWRDTRHVYAGDLVVTKDEEGTWYEFEGLRASRRCLRRYKSARRGARRCSRRIEW